MKTKTQVRGLEDDEAEQARQLLDGALQRNNMSTAQMRAALQAGLGRCSDGPPSTWGTPSSDAEGHRDAAARFLLRLARLCGIPLEGGPGATAVKVAQDLLQ